MRIVPLLSAARRYALAAGTLLIFAVASLSAQSPNLDPRSNPEGDAGILKPQVSTAGGYDVHSGNASRAITDLKFAGVPGNGMDVVRYWNSIYSIYSAPFGGGGWTHSFAWEAHVDLEEYEHRNGVNDVMTIVITHPQGHMSRHQVIRNQTGPPWSLPWPSAWGASGNTHLKDMAPDATSFCLYLDDGSTVFFVGDGGGVRSGMRVRS